MRNAIANALIAVGLIAGAAASAYYTYVMWNLDWGPQGTRGHNLMFVLMLFGAVIVFVLVAIAIAAVATWVNPELGRDK